MGGPSPLVAQADFVFSGFLDVWHAGSMLPPGAPHDGIH